ncbi:uncharacterized protein [Ovis canadensis]|uniref:uncharacterized protein n=1 Tax=Ovis canadensis TaxID=37174 RepID=UPI0037501771
MLNRRAGEPLPKRRQWLELRGACGSERPRQTRRESRRRRAPGGEETRRAGNVREKARGAHARERTLPPAGAPRSPLSLPRPHPTPGPPARTRPRLPSRLGARNPARESPDGGAHGNGRRQGGSGRRLLSPFSPSEGGSAFFSLLTVSVGTRLALRRLHEEGRRAYGEGEEIRKTLNILSKYLCKCLLYATPDRRYCDQKESITASERSLSLRRAENEMGKVLNWQTLDHWTTK